MAGSGGFGQWKVERDVNELVGAATVLGAKNADQRVELGWPIKTPASSCELPPGRGQSYVPDEGAPTMTQSMPPTADTAGVRHA